MKICVYNNFNEVQNHTDNHPPITCQTSMPQRLHHTKT